MINRISHRRNQRAVIMVSARVKSQWLWLLPGWAVCSVCKSQPSRRGLWTGLLSPQPVLLWEIAPSAAPCSSLRLHWKNLKGKPGPRCLLSCSFHLGSAGNCENTSGLSKMSRSLRKLMLRRPEICGCVRFCAPCAVHGESSELPCNFFLLIRGKKLMNSGKPALWPSPS